ncbi:unnamed protein product, partial [Pocillopora meandrina]
VGFRHGRERHWTSSGIPRTEQDKRNLGDWTSTEFSPYFNLNSIGYIHLIVNHSENFVDPYTGAHSNTIEGVWSQ